MDDAFTPHRAPHAGARVEARLRAYVSGLAASAIERDRRGGTPKPERDALRASGLLALSVPVDLGGDGASIGETLDAVRVVAQVDPSIAHVFAFHHLMLATIGLFGTRAQYERAVAGVVVERTFFGNALNPKDTRTQLVADGNRFAIDGVKSFCSGARDSDGLVVSALDRVGRLVVAWIPTSREGVVTHEDWDAIGQRQTDSGTVTLHHVVVQPDEILEAPGPLGSIRATLRPCYAQAIFAHIYLGIAEGAAQAAREGLGGGNASAVRDDPRDVLRRHRAGELYVALEAARALASRAALSLDASFARGEALTKEERGETALRIATAKVATTRASLAASEGLFDVLGARATATRLGLDRFWRNARTHTLHDPVDVKLAELGAYALYDELPIPSFYS